MPPPARPFRPTLLLALVLLALPALTGADPPPAALARVAAVLDSSETAVLWGLVVADARTGEVLAERNADRLLLPASNQKVLTLATAIERLGAGFRYRTPLLFEGKADTSGGAGTVLRGTFGLVGSGDPSFGSSEIRGPDPFEAWAKALRRRGVVRLEGTLVGDDDRFDDTPYAEGWDVDYLTAQAGRYLGAPVGALSYHDNLVRLRLGPGPTDAATSPPGTITVRRRDRATDRTRGLGFGLRRLPGTGNVEISGTTRRSENDLYLPVDDPTRFSLDAFAHALAREGIDTSALRRVDVDELPRRPDWRRADTLALHTSPPLADLLEILGTQSNNFYAEQVFRTLTPEGTVRAGQALVRRTLVPGGDTTRLALFDGSGLSRKNLVAPRVLAQALLRMYRHPDVDDFFRALPYPGQPGGTLEYRLDGVPVRAKTGSLTHARALSGYVRTASGRDLAFVIVANNYNTSDAKVVGVIDRIVRVLATA